MSAKDITYLKQQIETEGRELSRLYKRNAELVAKLEYTIGSWKKEEILNNEITKKLQAQLEKAEKVIEEIRDFDNNDHLDVVGCELQEIAREYFRDKELEK